MYSIAPVKIVITQKSPHHINGKRILVIVCFFHKKARKLLSDNECKDSLTYLSFLYPFLSTPRQKIYLQK